MTVTFIQPEDFDGVTIRVNDQNKVEAVGGTPQVKKLNTTNLHLFQHGFRGKQVFGEVIFDGVEHKIHGLAQLAGTPYAVFYIPSLTDPSLLSEPYPTPYDSSNGGVVP